MNITVSGTKMGKTVREVFKKEDTAKRWAALLKDNGYIRIKVGQ